MPSASEVARIQSAAQSDVGRTRSENQDAFGEFSKPSGERLFVVADGMGGHRGGATASRLCVAAIGQAFSDGSDPAEPRLRRGVELANVSVHAAAKNDSELSGMGTTVVALVLAPDGSGALGWVGDSRAYRFRDGALERLTTDHSVVGEMMRTGAITAEESESHPRRNELLRAIGPNAAVEPEMLALRHEPGDRFLLCSDGLWGLVPEAELATVLGNESPEHAVKKLIAMANERGGPDNVTVQIASVAVPVAEQTGSADSMRASRVSPALVFGAAAALLIAAGVYVLRQAADRKPQTDVISLNQRRLAAAPAPGTAPPASNAPASNFEILHAEVLEVNEAGPEGRVIRLDAGAAKGLRAGLRGRLIDGGREIGTIEIVEVYPAASLARVDDAASSTIGARSAVEIDIPITGAK